MVEELLLGLPFHPDPLIARALALLEAAPDTDAGIAKVACELTLSERQLERRFLTRVGLTPKHFATLMRFERALERVLARTDSSLTETALAAGYYDQSHFIREFRRFAGVAPGAFLRGQR